MKILVTDDSRAARMLIKSILSEYEGISEIVEAENGKEAIGVYQLSQPDLTFLDLTMPVMDGFEATKRILEIDPEAKIVILTADVQTQAIQRCIELGAIDVIKKLPRKEKIFEFLDNFQRGL